jgi:hypothetical protein
MAIRSNDEREGGGGGSKHKGPDAYCYTCSVAMLVLRKRLILSR